ncbi:MAG: HD domain-containing protein, partial [Desulfobulbaceae bacterium]
MSFVPVIGTSIKKQLENREEEILSPYAAISRESRGRRVLEQEDICDIRLPYQRDRDRIIHSKTFRRLKHKTQVFLAPTGDHYRTRLTHVLEVSQIARTVAAALCLNESLTEAIALGHDLGHTPFGHAGEATLNELHPSGFKHYIHSLRVIDFLENKGKGLNLTFEVRNGISRHSKGRNDIIPQRKSELAVT